MKSTRALLTFAYVADQFAKTNDIAQGLMPLFAPLISKRAGTPFDPVQFAEDVMTTYDLELHPFVAEEFAGPLSARGYLRADRQPGAVHYTNLHFELPDPPIHEQQLRELVDGFCLFSERLLDQINSHVSAEQLHSAFLDRLVQPDFLALLLRPDKPSSDPKILTLKRDDEQPDTESINIDQQFDYLVASYILHVNRSSPHFFELIVAAASGALVSEVILDLQHPLGDTQPIAGINVAVDSPLILDALELGHDRATPYAMKLIKHIQQAGATPVVFADTIEEIQGALKGPLQNYQRGLDPYGPLGRRLRTNSTVAPYVRSILPRIREEISRLGVTVVEITPVDRARMRTIFTETHETQLANELGHYESDHARRHDARVVADVLRLRGGQHSARLRDSKVVFVTRNTRLVSQTRRYLTERSIIARDYFPPCISDRHLAGLLWISIGGSGESLTRLRLVANCSAAVMPRRELVSRMHRFFRDLNPTKMDRFEALMTNERAEHFLMERTLSDEAVITQRNFEEIYSHIEEAAAERVAERKDEEIATLKASHSQQIRGYEAKVTELAQTSQTANRGRQELVDEKDALAARLNENETTWARACLDHGRRVVSIIRAAQLVSIALLATISAVIDDHSLGLRFLIGILAFVSALAGGMLGSRFWPTNPLERWIAKTRDASVRKFAQQHGVEDVLLKFELDWQAKVVKPKE